MLSLFLMKDEKACFDPGHSDGRLPDRRRDPVRGFQTELHERPTARRTIPGERIFTRDGRSVAVLQELLVDANGEIQYGVIACPARQGPRGKLIPVPWEAFERRAVRGLGSRLCLQLVTDLLREMRGYDPCYWPALHPVI